MELLLNSDEFSKILGIDFPMIDGVSDLIKRIVSREAFFDVGCRLVFKAHLESMLGFCDKTRVNHTIEFQNITWAQFAVALRNIVLNDLFLL